MIGRKQELNIQFQQIIDGLLIVLAFWAAHSLRAAGSSWIFFDKPIGPFADFQWLLFVILPFGPILLELQGFYSHPMQKNLGRSVQQLGRAAIWLGLLIAACSYFLRLEVPSRAVMPLFGVIAATLLLMREQFSILRRKKRLKKEDLRELVLLAGTRADMQALRESFSAEQVMEIKVSGEIDLESEPLEAFIEALHEHSVSRVFFAGSHGKLSQLQDAIAACETEGVEAWVVADFIRTAIARPVFDVFGGRPMLVFRTTPDLSWALLVKDLVDRLGALAGLVIFGPLFVGIALGIRLTSPGPIIFRQQRSGKNGRPFTMYKFRSMHSDAEMQRDELVRFNVMSGPVFKLEQDPRVTPFGRFLRKSSFDELPQLWNVFKGEMSLVGPRPLPIYEVERFENPAQRRRLSMKPGLTCLWQVGGRSNLNSFDHWVKLDLEYIDNWSLGLDMKILLKTLPVVLFGRGAR